jgi:hypothetical protein
MLQQNSCLSVDQGWGQVPRSGAAILWFRASSPFDPTRWGFGGIQEGLFMKMQLYQTFWDRRWQLLSDGHPVVII